MPTVTYIGVYYESRRKDSCESWVRGKPVEVSVGNFDYSGVNHNES